MVRTLIAVREFSLLLAGKGHQVQASRRLISRRKLVAGSAVAAFGIPIAAMPARYAGQIYPGAAVEGVALHGLEWDEALEKLQHHFVGFEQRAATFAFESNLWNATLLELGGAIDYEATLNAAMDHGRESLAARYTTFFAADATAAIEPVVTFNETQARGYIESLAPAIDIAARNARLYREGGEIQAIQSVEGRSLDRDSALEAVRAVVESTTFAAIELTTVVEAPEVTTEALEKYRGQALRLIGEPIVLRHGELNYPVYAEQLAQALIINKENKPQIDPSRLAERLDAIAADMYVAPTNIMLGWDSGLYIVKDDVEGLEMDREAAEQMVVDLASSTERTGEMPTRVAKAAANRDNYQELGLETHLAMGSSSFAGSSWERAANVAAACTNASFKLVAPGELFSFNELLGPITHEMGYVDGTIISGDWTASDIGGGVCQVSTTVFRAAARAGFLFTEWHPHTWRLAFYEMDGSPPGFDAAIYQPNGPGQMTLDLSFVNVLDSWLLLMMVVDGQTAYAHLYGKDPGWTVTFGDVQVSDPIQPGKPVERVNPSLARGERKWVSNSAPGYHVVVPRKVVAADGTVISDSSFVSDYAAQPETWEVGPK